MIAGRRQRRGFSLLEVMIALAILTVSLILLVETQSSAVLLTTEAEKIIVATDLARTKLSEVLIEVEKDGFQASDQSEFGDFSSFGDDLLDAEFGDELDEYHWEYLVSEVDIETLGDLASAAQELPGEEGDAAVAGPLAGLGALGIGPEMITDFLAPYVREIRVRVWWGKDSEQAEENGNEVVVTTHVINPSGAVSLEQGLPQ